jgi:microcin C transport system permease protein
MPTRWRRSKLGAGRDVERERVTEGRALTAYILRRLLLIAPTLFAIMVINFTIVQFAPGGPIDQIISQIQGTGVDATARVSGQAGGEMAASATSPDGGRTRGTRGLDPQLIAQLERQFGFDKPLHERFLTMMGNYLVFDFGDSFFRARRVIDLVLEKMPVSISLGVWTTLLVYLISIPLGIRKAVRDGSRFDVWTSGVIIVGNAIPAFLFAVLLVVLFAGGSYMQIFPLRGLVSSNWSELSLVGKVLDYLWHMVLPLTAMVIGGFASLTMLTKNSFLEEINKQYVLTARAKGLSERGVLYGHVFRNAMLIVIAGFPSAFVGVLFTGSLFIEIIFSLDGLGLLGYEAALNRDYPVMFGTLFFFTLLGLLLNLIGDLMYVAIDPRIDFEARET